jgi:hypothetical protein
MARPSVDDVRLLPRVSCDCLDIIRVRSAPWKAICNFATYPASMPTTNEVAVLYNSSLESTFQDTSGEVGMGDVVVNLYILSSAVAGSLERRGTRAVRSAACHTAPSLREA